MARALPSTGLFSFFLSIGRLFRPLLPGKLKEKIPQSTESPGDWPAARHQRRMLVLAGCVQPALAPEINAAAARVLDRAGISLIEAPGAGCCGAVRFHLNEQEAGRDDMRALIDAWWPMIESDEIEAIVMTASGCGVFTKEFVHHLKDDPDYREKAERISAMTKDLCEVLPEHGIEKRARPARIAFQSPCSLQHGQQIRDKVEALLRKAGYELEPVADGHLCCGSAGTYSILQPELSTQLRDRKLAVLAAGGAGIIATANIGCLSHLQTGTRTPVRHWVQLLDE